MMHAPESAVSATMIDDVTLDGQNLSIEQTVAVARFGVPVKLSGDSARLTRVERSCAYIAQAVASEVPIYGVTTGFGGMANVIISATDAIDLQNNLIWYHKVGAGPLLPHADVRAAMLLRANSHMLGASGIRLELIQRLITFLNAGVTPHVRSLGSIGASGDLVPLTSIAGALIGADPNFLVDYQGETLDCLTALKHLGLEPISLRPKEGLAMINGTSVMTAIAAHCVYDAQNLLGLALGIHALMIQALRGTNQSFHPFIHQHKPHPGQRWIAAKMLELLKESQLSRNEMDGSHDHRKDDLIQDRYSLRCLPQYLGPLAEGMTQVSAQITTEMNSASDNPLIDSERQLCYHGGNFLGEYIGVGMDHLRYYLGLLAKHLDVQIALLTAPQFSNGLPPSLVGNQQRPVNMGLKGLQMAGNSIMPLLTFMGNSLADRFPTHAEQFNQNINSQGFGSANLARQSIEVFHQYAAIALMFAVQAVDLRTYQIYGTYNAEPMLSPMSAHLYTAMRETVGVPPQTDRPYIWNDDEQLLEAHIAKLADDIAAEGRIIQAVVPVVQALRSLSIRYNTDMI